MALHAPAAKPDPQVCRRDVDLVYAAALRRCRGDEHAAGDVTGAVFLTLARRPDAAAESARALGSLGPWLLATTRHVAANAQRQRRRREHHERQAAMNRPDVASADPSVALAWRDLAPLLDDAVLSLRPADRAAVLMRYYEDRPSAEIAAALNCTPVAARQRVSRALDKLRKKLARRGVEVPAATLAAAVAGQAVRAAPAVLTRTCLDLAAGGAASAAIVSLTTGGSVMTPLILKSAAAALALAGAATTAALVAGGDGTGNAATAPASTVAATMPATTKSVADPMALAAEIDAAVLPPSDRVIERTLTAEPGEDRIDLDTGRVYALRRDAARLSGVWLDGVDAMLGRDPLAPGVVGLRLVVRPVVPAAWDLAVSDPRLAELWDRRPLEMGETMDAVGPLPRTFLFRTEEGAGGVLQVVERGEDEDGSPGPIRLRYKVLVRGEGVSVSEQVSAAVAPEDEPPARVDERERRMLAVRDAMTVLLLYKAERGEYPPDLTAARAFVDGEFAWPAGLPDSLVYARPSDDPAFPRLPRRPVLFERLTLPADAEPFVAVGFEDGSAQLVGTQAELDALTQRAGLRPAAEPARGEAADPLDRYQAQIAAKEWSAAVDSYLAFLADLTPGQYRDKKDFGGLLDAYAAANPNDLVGLKTLAADKLEQHKANDLAAWRLHRLLADVAKREGDAAAERERAAIDAYPKVDYPEPAKHGSIQHLYNRLAVLTAAAEGGAAAQELLLKAFASDERYVAFYLPPLKEELGDAWLRRYVAGLTLAYEKKIANEPRNAERLRRERDELRQAIGG